MGFLDGLFKAAKNIDKIAGDVGLSKLADEAKKTLNGALGNNTESSPAKPAAESFTPAHVIATGNTPVAPYKTAEGCYFDETGEHLVYFEIPSDFEKFDSHAEPSMCHLYMYDEKDDEDIDLNKPIICMTPEFYEKIEGFQKTGKIAGAIMCESVCVGPMFVRAKMNCYKNDTVYFYGFEQGESKNRVAIAVQYKRDVIGTPLEEKLMKILDHCAETYEER